MNCLINKIENKKEAKPTKNDKSIVKINIYLKTMNWNLYTVCLYVYVCVCVGAIFLNALIANRFI